MTTIQGGLGALDMPLTPEVFAPPKGGIGDAPAWIDAREQLLGTIQRHGHKALFPDLDGEYFDGLQSILASRAGMVGDDTYQVLVDLLDQVTELGYQRPVPGFVSTIDADDRDAVGKAISAAHGSITTDVLADCAVAEIQDPLKGIPCPTVGIPGACKHLLNAPESERVRLCNASIVDLVFPLASRFEFVAVTGQFLTPDKAHHELPKAEIDFVKKLLEALLQRGPFFCKRFEVHFVEHRRKSNDGRPQPPKYGKPLENLMEVALGRDVLAGLEKRGVELEFFQWEKRLFPFSKDRHLVVGDAQSSQRGLWIPHFGNDACDEGDEVVPLSTKAMVMDTSDVTGWHTGFRLLETRLKSDELPERRTRINGRWLADDEERPT